MREPFSYIDCSLPEQMTLPEYRRLRCERRPRTRRPLWRRVVGR